jgi:glycosyltransferase 2 family protein
MSGPISDKGKGRILAIARVVAGLAILFFVAQTIPWRDQLLWRSPSDPGSAELVVAGVIEGDWTGDRIEFAPDRGALGEDPWPEAVGTAAARGESVAVERRDEKIDPGGYDWKPGMPRVFGGVRLAGLLPAIGLLTIAMAVVVTRWWRLLALVGCRTRWFGVVRLTLLGYFFNLVVPGLTGGDLVKAVIAAKENPGRRPDALVSVAVDRLVGLAALAGLATVVILLSGETFAVLRAPLLFCLGGGVVAVLLYANPFLRRLLRVGRLFDWLFDRLPLGDKLRSLDRAAVLYLRHPLEMVVALGLSLVNHVLVILALFALGSAFGGADQGSLGLREYFVATPVANIVSALPLAPGGWGLGEAAYKHLFEMVGGSGTIGVAISVTFRLILLGFGLLGGIYLLLPGGKAEVAAAERASERASEVTGEVAGENTGENIDEKTSDEGREADPIL